MQGLLNRGQRSGSISSSNSNNQLKDILTEAMESINYLDSDEVQRLLASSAQNTPNSKSRRPSIAGSEFSFSALTSGQVRD